MRFIGQAALLLSGAGIIGGVSGWASSSRADVPTAVESERISDCRITDGDTIRCGSERIRLLGIDAPEKDGNCRPGRECAPGDPVASTESLRAALHGPITIERVGTDRFGRTLGVVRAGGTNLSCRQLEQGQAIYKPRWDNGDRIRKACPAVAM